MRLRVLSLNTWGLPFGLARDLPRRTEALGRTFAGSDADVIALQEVWTGRARTRLRQAAANAGFEHAFFVDRSRANAGLVVFSRWPFARGRVHHYRVRGRAERVQHGDFWSGKGWLDLVVATPGGEVRLVDTHLHAAYTERDEADEYAGERMAQIVELAHGLRDSSAPIVAVGDFNMHEGSDEYVVWRGLAGMTDVAAALGQRQTTVIDRNGRLSADEARGRIDYAFVRDGAALALRALSIERSFDETIDLGGRPGHYSDHAGLRVELELEATPASYGRRATRDPARRAELIALARSRIEAAAAQTRVRARHQTTIGLAGLVASGAAGFAGDLATRNRRSLLRTLAFAGPGLGLLASGTTLALGQAYTRSAAWQLDAVAGLLQDFEAP